HTRGMYRLDLRTGVELVDPGAVQVAEAVRGDRRLPGRGAVIERTDGQAVEDRPQLRVERHLAVHLDRAGGGVEHVGVAGAAAAAAQLDELVGVGAEGLLEGT